MVELGGERGKDPELVRKRALAGVIGGRFDGEENGARRSGENQFPGSYAHGHLPSTR